MEPKFRALGFLEPSRGQWRLAAWFADFVNAVDKHAVRAFKAEAAVLAGSHSAEGLIKGARERLFPGSSSKTEAISDDDLLAVQHDARQAINWRLEEHEAGSVLFLPPITGEESLQWTGEKPERRFLPHDFRGRILSRLFTLLSSEVSYFARCATCHKIFARRGRRIYCNRLCQVRARPVEDVREYQRDYMREKWRPRHRRERET